VVNKQVSVPCPTYSVAHNLYLTYLLATSQTETHQAKGKGAFVWDSLASLSRLEWCWSRLLDVLLMTYTPATSPTVNSDSTTTTPRPMKFWFSLFSGWIRNNRIEVMILDWWWKEKNVYLNETQLSEIAFKVFNCKMSKYRKKKKIFKQIFTFTSDYRRFIFCEHVWFIFSCLRWRES